MKTLYILSILIGLVIVAMWNLVIVVPPKGSVEAITLAREPSKWKIEILEDSMNFKDENEIKTGLISFIEAHRGSQYFNVPYMTALGAVMIVYGGLGLYQTIRLKHYLNQNHEAKRTSSVGPVA
ncbi:MAG: hypothetical protein JJU29_04840 [Verrucomicrobia bacterium]|nr:hypothetical protein [Verrucomicrobiota bacterium]MCH8510265.1 hypothetical protein [Kiritimatiellia bacterium]